jgi:hypothetical protein
MQYKLETVCDVDKKRVIQIDGISSDNLQKGGDNAFLISDLSDLHQHAITQNMLNMLRVQPEEDIPRR